MRRVLLVVVLAVLSVSVPHQTAAPPVRSAGTPESPDLGSSKLPVPRSTLLFLALWGDGPGGVRSELTEPASERLQRVYGEVLRDAVRWKFRFLPPALYQTNEFVPIFIPDPPICLYGRYFVGPNRILIEQSWAEKMTDTELRVLLAHELGHAIDCQTERIGHWSFPPVYLYGQQEFADHIARLLVGIDEVRSFNSKYIYIASRNH